MMASIITAEALAGRDAYCMNYLKALPGRCHYRLAALSRAKNGHIRFTGFDVAQQFCNRVDAIYLIVRPDSLGNFVPYFDAMEINGIFTANCPLRRHRRLTLEARE
jgi:hypothetical protein